jgi:hypothetical protein
MVSGKMHSFFEEVFSVEYYAAMPATKPFNRNLDRL